MLLEAHLDFARDFRGDTIHPPTLELLDRLGLSQPLHALPHGVLRQFVIHAGSQVFTLADLSRLPSRFPYMMLLPQEKLLDLLACHAQRYPHLRVQMGAQANQLLWEQGRVVGVTYRQAEREQVVRAPLTIAADGRFSKLRKLAGLEPIRTAPPMDIVWFRLPRYQTDPTDQGVVVNQGRFCVLLNREQQWQIGFVIAKGGYRQLHALGLRAFRTALSDVVPWLSDRLHLLDDWSTLTLLSVESSRLSKWYLPGLLFIGDAAHAMSPVGGVGINYAVQDAIAAANILAEPLRTRSVQMHHLAAVQRRREWPVRVIQFIQGILQRNLVAEALDRGKAFHLPLPLQIIFRLPILRELPSRIIGLGVGRERVPPALPGV